MSKFLVDINLPRYFSLWKIESYIFQYNINSSMPDNKIWDYAKLNKLTIITKDSDFSDKILFHEPPPKVIHIKFGNMRMKQFHEVMNKLWADACEMSESYKLVNVYKDRIEGIE